jgi:DNA-directed RNA polymerase I subunit RPA2
LENLGAPHVNSFNHFLEDGMKTIIDSLEPYEFELINGERIKIQVENCEITAPKITSQIDVKERRVFPSEARQRSITYTGNCSMTLGWSKNGSRNGSIDFDLGPIPIMIRVSCLNKIKTHF